MLTLFNLDVYLLFQRLIAVLDELEALKPEFQRRLHELNRANGGVQLLELDSSDRISYGAETSSLELLTVNKKSNPRMDMKQVLKQQHHW